MSDNEHWSDRLHPRRVFGGLVMGLLVGTFTVGFVYLAVVALWQVAIPLAVYLWRVMPVWVRIVLGIGALWGIFEAVRE